MKYSIFMLLIALHTGSCTRPQDPSIMIDKTTVQGVDLDRYLGTWYEIARFPHSFEKNLVGVKATYSYRKDGKIEVLNQGYKDHLDGPLKMAKGKAKVPDPDDPARLKVSFFLFFYADYFILELDQENYQWAMVGSTSDNFLWFLCRSPEMDSDVFEMLKQRARDRGYDISLLERVPQKSVP